MERGSDSAKRQAKEEVPGDRIKDAPALARELRWRVRHAAGYSSDDDARGSRHSKSRATPSGEPATNGSNKRKRSVADTGEDSTELFRNFKPRGWDRVEERATQRESRVVKARRPREESQVAEWVRESGDAVGGDDGEAAHVERRRDVVVKVRRTAKGIERQTAERVLEEWTWDSAASPPGHVAKTEPADVSMDDGPTAGSTAEKVGAAEGVADTQMNEQTSPPASSLANGHSTVDGEQ